MHQLDVVGKFWADLERGTARSAAMRTVGAVVFQVSAETTTRRVDSRTQRAPETKQTYTTRYEMLF